MFCVVPELSLTVARNTVTAVTFPGFPETRGECVCFVFPSDPPCLFPALQASFPLTSPCLVFPLISLPWPSLPFCLSPAVSFPFPMVGVSLLLISSSTRSPPLHTSFLSLSLTPWISKPFNNCLSSTYQVPGPVLGIRDTAVNETEILILLVLTFRCGGLGISQIYDP